VWRIDYCYSGRLTPGNQAIVSSDGNIFTLFGQSPPPSSAVRLPLDRTGCNELTNHFFSRVPLFGFVPEAQGFLVIAPSGNTHAECTGTFIRFGF
jgi:hypothetical protein